MNVSSEKEIIAGMLQPCARDEEESTQRKGAAKRAKQEATKLFAEKRKNRQAGERAPSRRGSDLLQVDVDFRRRFCS